jgi:hypothetical protein
MATPSRTLKKRINKKVTVRKKRCSDCHRTRAAEYYWRNSSSEDGLFNQCKPCAIKRQKPENRTGRPENYEQPVRKRTSRGIIRAEERKVKTLARVDSQPVHDGFAEITVVRDGSPRRRRNPMSKRKRNMKPVTIRVQECRVCHKRLSVTKFAKSKRHNTGRETACNFCKRLLSLYYKELGPDPRINYERAVEEYGGTMQEPEEKATRHQQSTAVAKVQMGYMDDKCACCSNGHLEFLQELFDKYKLVPKG